MLSEGTEREDKKTCWGGSIVPLGPKQTFLTRQKRSSNSLTLKCNPKARGFVYSKARSTAGRKLVSQCSPVHGSGRHGGWGAEWEPRGPTWRGACPPHPPLQRDTKQCKAGRVSLLSEVQFGGAAVRSIIISITLNKANILLYIF